MLQDILSATVQHKETFQHLVTASPRLRLVDMPGWAGLGGERYVPEGWEQLMTDQAKEELNRLNVQLVDQLRNTDAAFSLGECEPSEGEFNLLRCCLLKKPEDWVAEIRIVF
jgi:hypothetical protein